jgi:hypothetical protein
MADSSRNPLPKTKFEVWLEPNEVEILQKYRGDLSPEAFITVLIRILDSGAVSDIPDWVRQASGPKKDSDAS